MKVIDETLKIARSQVGVREVPQGSNWGPQIEEYLASVGWRKPAPWCAAFAYWCVERGFAAGAPAGQSNPLLRTASCALIDAWAKEHEALRDAPEPGDLFLIRGMTESGWHAHHTGLVASVVVDSFVTIEGNTNLGGSREGIGVFARTRRVVRNAVAFVRWADLLDVRPDLTYKLMLNGTRAPFDLPVRDGRALAPVRAWGTLMGFQVAWDDIRQRPMFNGIGVLATVSLMDGTAYAPIRDLARDAGLALTVDAKRQTVAVSR